MGKLLVGRMPMRSLKQASLFLAIFAVLCFPFFVYADQILNATVRDFQKSHPDFEKGISGLVKGLVGATLPSDKKPVFVGAPGAGAITNAATFAQWYNDVPSVNQSTTLPLTLTETASGSGIFDLNVPNFFPIDGMLFGNEGLSHNYHFTLKLHTTFTYRPGQTFQYTGDDDMWVYINNRLVVDLGGVHDPASASVALDTLGLTPGNTYDFDLYFAERHTVSSVFHIQTSIVFDPQRRAGWHSNDGRNSLICDSSRNCPGLKPELRILLGNMYVYESPVVDPLYWYVQVIYANESLTRVPIDCVGRADAGLVKEHMQGTPNAGLLPAEETFCSRNKNFSGYIEPGETHYEWAIFHNVPWSGKDSMVRIEWGPYGFSDWFAPWDRPYPDDVRKVSPPAECPDELVRFGKCQEDNARQPLKVHLSRTPEGKAPHLVILVHGCCTTPDAYLKEWYQERGDAVISAIAKENAKQKEKARAWEIVVFDWTSFTPVKLDFHEAGDYAYSHAFDPGMRLGEQIGKYPYYKYIHLIGHSAGSNLIDEAAKRLDADKKLKNKERLFVHLTFLDAYTPPDGDDLAGDDDKYGALPYNYLEHFAEHYVDKGLLLTDTDLKHAFNFDITDWTGNPQIPADKKESTPLEFGHQWPPRWYTRSIEFPERTGDLGFKLSLEGGYEAYSTLSQRFEPGKSCKPTDVLTSAICGIKLP